MTDRARNARYTNWISAVGVVSTTVSAILFIVFLVLDLAGFQSNPYLGIISFLLLPAVFVFGLLLIPLGLWRQRRHAARFGVTPSIWPTIDFSHRRVRIMAIVVLALTGVNVAIVAAASFKTVEYVDSTDFCTGACHTPMQPEAIAHQRAVHASISCASCHVGPGPEGFVQAKLGGVRRLAAVITGDYAGPIPVPVHDLPSAVGTCTSCHNPERYVGERLRQITYFSDDEDTTEQVTTLILQVGGGGYEGGGPHGIHWHASPQRRIEYVATDDSRTTIPWVRVTDARGTREYTAEGATAEQVAGGQRRVMDCTDCHNRVGHPLAATVDRAVDEALASGGMPRLPFVRREAIAAAGAEYPSSAAAGEAIAEKLNAFYGTQRLDDARVAQAVAATQRVYSSNVFPAMNVTWGTYPSHIGHTDAPGCFRCHDERTTPAGRTITQDCEACHHMQ
ncbi:MAG TPA: NapC/NirT family cytochrome c [Vicinamibacterales bacterium]|nr:NapC/NirT family cytochrome c [Vicinamibacterales bacterium]